MSEENLEWKSLRLLARGNKNLVTLIDSCEWTKRGHDWCEWYRQWGNTKEYAYITVKETIIDPEELDNRPGKHLVDRDDVNARDEDLRWLFISIKTTPAYQYLEDKFKEVFGDVQVVILLDSVENIAKASKLVLALREFLSNA